MKSKNFKYVGLFVLSASLFLSCEDDVVKSDYENNEPLSAVTMVSYDVTQVSSNFAVFEGSDNSGEEVDCGILFADNVDLTSAKNYPIEVDGAFLIRASGLSPNSTYYYASYEVKNGEISAIGELNTFQTLDGVVEFSIDYLSASEDDWTSAGFSSIDKDGDNMDWGLTEYDSDAGQIAFVSYSWSGSALTPENYLLFPKMNFNGVFGVFNFSVQSGDPDWAAETIKLVASSSPITVDNCRDAEVLHSITLSDGSVYNGSVDIPSAYEGASIYFALLHTESSNMFNVFFLKASFSYAK